MFTISSFTSYALHNSIIVKSIRLRQVFVFALVFTIFVFCAAFPSSSPSYASFIRDSTRLPRGGGMEILSERRDAFPLRRQTDHAGQTIAVSDVHGCPSVDASMTTSNTTGPNGSLFFLNCGISATNQKHGQWNPPTIKIDQIVINVDLSSDQTVNASVFRHCLPYMDVFRNESAAIGLPPIILTAFAMQESGCNALATGAGGTAGLLQLSPEKCLDTNCYDPTTNVRIGAQYLQSLLNQNSNILTVVGGWNGWFVGMTFADALAARSWDCYAQQNLDYLHQYFNGWLQGINAYGQAGVNDRLGYYFNLDLCDHNGGLPTFNGPNDARQRATFSSYAFGTALAILVVSHWLL